MKKRNLFLQLFADDANGVASDTATAENVNSDQTAAKEQSAETKKADEKAEKKYSDKDLDEILSKKFARWQEKQQKAVDEAKKLAEMNAQQKAEYERDQLRKELDALKKKDALAEMTNTARKMLSDAGISVSDDVLSVLVTTDAEKTKAAIDGFTKAYTADVEKAVKDRLKGAPPRKGAGGVGSMTKEQIMAIRDPQLRQKAMLENKHLFNF